MKTVVINATAARTSGALTILKDFMAYMYLQHDCDLKIELITTTESIFTNAKNITVHQIPPQSWKNRILWDRINFQKWIKEKKIMPDLIVSFQNTCSYLSGKNKNVKTLVYYHQPLPLVKYKWKLYKKNEIKFFLYANFYSFFVNRWNKNAEYVVQLQYIKDLFCKKFRNITPSRVHVIRPNLPIINIHSVVAKNLYSGKKILMYPATALEYKNHAIILDALELLRKDDYALCEKIIILFTVSEDSEISERIKFRGLNSVIKCIGNIPYNELLSYYKGCDALLFPSKIETFGLPLIESAMFGIPIIAADLPYAKEVLKDYSGARFVAPDSSEIWKDQIKIIISSDLHFPPIVQKEENTWSSFFSLMKKL